jgi:hypothetical protein
MIRQKSLLAFDFDANPAIDPAVGRGPFPGCGRVEN